VIFGGYMELVSVIITTYKRPVDVVLRAVNSVLAQSYKDIELIIVDDSPNTFENRQFVAMSINEIDDNRVRYIQHEINKGACAARNTGIRNSSGNLIAFLDDDDVWHVNKLEKQVQKMNSENYGLVYCRQRVINEIKNTETEAKKQRYEGNVFDQLILTNFVGSTSFVMIRRECFDKVGLFDEEMPASQDLEMWLRIAKEFQIGFVDEALVDYYIHEGESITGNIDKKRIAVKKLLDKYEVYFNSHRRQRAIRYVKASPYFAVSGEYREMIKYYFKGVMSAPYMVRFNFEFMLRNIRAVFLKVI
jgi:glycosyltransferase involved in cell wall biosynthesis